MAVITRAASDPTFDAAKLDHLLAVKERWDKEEARKAFVADMAKFHEDPPVVMKDKLVSYKTNTGTTSYKHATLGNTSRIVGAHLAKFGFSHRWVPQQKDGKIAVTCILTHALGHSESVTLEAPYDQSGGKNAVQAIVSAKTYLERQTLMGVTGLASMDEDDDGVTAEPRPVSAPIKGPEEAPAGWVVPTEPAAKSGTDTFTVGNPFLYKVKGGIEFRGQNPSQAYLIHEDVARLAKKNFKEGDTATVGWALKDGKKVVKDLDRVAPKAKEEQGTF
jgi:hypothetical protein